MIASCLRQLAVLGLTPIINGEDNPVRKPLRGSSIRYLPQQDAKPFSRV